MEPIFLTAEAGVKLLKEGKRLTAHLSQDRSTLQIVDDIFEYEGTYYTEDSVKSLITSYTWHINLKPKQHENNI